MKSNTIIILLFLFAATAFGQSKEQKEIRAEGEKLYRSEMASWYGTDILMEKFNDRKEHAGGYFSYTENNRSICVFFSNDQTPKILSTITFDSTYNVNTAIIDGLERALTQRETDLMTIRQIALTQLSTDTLFKRYQDMNPNLIPLSDEKGKRVYILTGPQKQGIVVFGNDYLLTFNDANKLKDKKRLHKNIIGIEYGKKDGETVIATMHSHLPETGDLITATDICTLKLYGKYARWGQHYVVSQENVSIWDCHKQELLVMTRKAWDRMNKSSEKK